MKLRLDCVAKQRIRSWNFNKICEVWFITRMHIFENF